MHHAGDIAEMGASKKCSSRAGAERQRQKREEKRRKKDEKNRKEREKRAALRLRADEENLRAGKFVKRFCVCIVSAFVHRSFCNCCRYLSSRQGEQQQEVNHFLLVDPVTEEEHTWKVLCFHVWSCLCTPPPALLLMCVYFLLVVTASCRQWQQHH